MRFMITAVVFRLMVQPYSTDLTEPCNPTFYKWAYFICRRADSTIRLIAVQTLHQFDFTEYKVRKQGRSCAIMIAYLHYLSNLPRCTMNLPKCRYVKSLVSLLVIEVKWCKQILHSYYLIFRPCFTFFLFLSRNNSVHELLYGRNRYVIITLTHSL